MTSGSCSRPLVGTAVSFVLSLRVPGQHCPAPRGYHSLKARVFTVQGCLRRGGSVLSRRETDRIQAAHGTCPEHTAGRPRDFFGMALDFFNALIELQFTYHMLLSLKGHNSAVSSKCAGSSNHPHRVFQSVSSRIKNPHAQEQPLPSPPPHGPWRPLSCFLFVRIGPFWMLQTHMESYK